MAVPKNLCGWFDKPSTVPNNSSCKWEDMEAERKQFEQDIESIFGESPADLKE